MDEIRLINERQQRKNISDPNICGINAEKTSTVNQTSLELELGAPNFQNDFTVSNI